MKLTKFGGFEDGPCLYAEVDNIEIKVNENSIEFWEGTFIYSFKRTKKLESMLIALKKLYEFEGKELMIYMDSKCDVRKFEIEFATKRFFNLIKNGEVYYRSKINFWFRSFFNEKTVEHLIECDRLEEVK